MSYNTRTSNVPVCQFQHTRIYFPSFVLTPDDCIIISQNISFVKRFFEKKQIFFDFS